MNYLCRMCQRSFHSMATLLGHDCFPLSQLYSETEDMSFKCTKCDLHFSAQNGLKNHFCLPQNSKSTEDMNNYQHTILPKSTLTKTEENLKQMYSADKAPSSDPMMAQKKDANKAPVFRGLFAYFPRALVLIANVSGFGQQKYGAWGGWVKVPDAAVRYEDALLRHTAAMARGEQRDPESGLPHAAHRAWCALAVLELASHE